jgi:cytochrome c
MGSHMKKLILSIAACSLAGIGSLSLARVHPFGDAGLFAGRPAQSRLMENSSVPPEVRAVLIQKCADCHSVQTRAPLYGRFAPVSWLLERDIVAGRQHMDLSRWESYSSDQRQNLQAQIIQQTKTGKMPLPQYLLIHRQARITNADLRVLRMWAGEAPLETGVALDAGPGDATRGKAVFEKRCTGCHALEQNREGPRLAGVYGRASGTVPDFPYSSAVKQAHIVWDDKSLAQWLADPDTLVPGNDMAFHVAKPDERRDLIAFLKAGSTALTVSEAR